jgi:hypothetical protein
MTTAQAANRQQAAVQSAMSLEGFQGIGRTGGCVAAPGGRAQDRGFHRRQHPSVELHQHDQDGLKRIQRSCRSRARRNATR